MADEKILVRIKKLMALAGSNNPHEAANALRKAQLLMQANELSASDIAMSDVTEHSVRLANSAVKHPLWSHLLMRLIESAFGVKSFYNPNCKIITFIGIKENSQIASYCYEVLSRQLKSGRTAFLASLNPSLKRKTKTSRADKYCEGWVIGVQQHITKLVPTQEQSEMIKKYTQLKQPDLIEAKSRESKNNKSTDKALFAGFMDGKKVRLNAGMTGSENVKLANAP